jgi:hypothetical protein
MANGIISFQPKTRGPAMSGAARQREFRRQYPHYNRLVKAWQRGDLQGLLPNWISSRREETAVRALFRSPVAEKVVEVLQDRLLLRPAERKCLPVPADMLALLAPAEPAALPAPVVIALPKPTLALPAPADPVDIPTTDTSSETGGQLVFSYFS